MPENKKISLNFGRLGQQEVRAMAGDTLGDVPAPQGAPAEATTAKKPRTPIVFTMIDDNTLEVREKGLVSTFNFASQQVTYVSEGAAVNVAVMAFKDVLSPTAVSDAFANLKMLGGNPKSYSP